MRILSPFRKMATAFFPMLLLLVSCNTSAPVSIEGEARVWHTLTLSFSGPETAEGAWPNPFLDYRMEVQFSCGGDTIRVPGYFAADGHAAESSAAEGNIWQVRFTPDKTGTWHYRAGFRTGRNVAVSNDPLAGEACGFDGESGSFEVTESDKEGVDFRAHGRLEYNNERYLRFAGSGKYFLKGGADSPENFLAYVDFDDTWYGGSSQHRSGEDNPSQGLHQYLEHVKDWKQGDPVWYGDKGKGMIGALNYLSGKGMNAVYFLTMNVLGDGDDVWPWSTREERYRFDCSKLDQWEIVFSHMEKLGLMMHVVLQETENECLLDVGRLDIQRKLYLREIIARFGHHLAITWNIGEESGPAHWTPVGQTIEDRMAMMRYIRETDPYNSYIVSHTHAADPDHSRLIEPFLGYPYMEGPSLQLSPPALVHEKTLDWIARSASAGRPWVVCSDELGPHWSGVMPDAVDPAHDTIRREALWGNLMAGGAGVEWYFGYKYAHADLGCEDWRSRDIMWDQTRYALEFFQTYLPFASMTAHDEWAGEGYCLAKAGEIYAIYLPFGGETTLDLRNTGGSYQIEWYNPREGGPLQKGSLEAAEGGRMISTGQPPSDEDMDWLCLIRAVSQ